MKLEQAITEILVLAGGNQKLAEQIAPILKKAGSADTVPDTTMNKVLAAGKALKKLGVR